ncbi:MAG TPA: sugar phosphate nucleotidyltransferase, partial [Caulobacteraceae bacterium]|nr:sugar phosphate nucleotidyltransferase [Caulobacteraceae bacterium]
LFGVTPSFPATAYGYIEPVAGPAMSVRAVARFLEKPDAERAAALIAAGCLWNSGLFLMSASRLIEELAEHEPAVLAAARAALERAEADTDFLRLDLDAFAAAPSIAIDHAVMERTQAASVIAADFGWSDIGAWSAVWDAQERDHAGNATIGKVVLEESSGALVYAEGVRVAAHGVEDLVIVATPDRVLVVPRRHDQAVRRLGERADGL